MLSNMAASLIMHKRIKTTLAKAKALRIYVEPLLTKAKDDTTNSRRVVFSYLADKNAVSELFREIAPKIANRQGGYTRILKTGFRLGDNAEMALIELVDYNENMLSDGKAKTKTRRSRAKAAPAAAPVAAPAIEPEVPVAEEPAVVEEAPEMQVEAEAAPAPAEETPTAEAISDAEVVEEETK
jgi:large subunit ribosomal protein L17